MILGLEFPPLSHLVNWPEIVGDNVWGINKVVLVYALSALLTILIFTIGNKGQLVPTGAQNAAEMSIEFVENQIILPTMGTKGLRWTAYMVSLFFFIFFCNIFEIVPFVQMPANARIALPMFLALLTFVLYNAAGIREHGFFGYLKHSLMPPGVPALLYVVVIPIELVSNFFIRPFSHMVRLFANLLAGHILLVTFAILTATLWTTEWYAAFLPLPLFGVIAFTAFEILVSFLQAYVFTLLAGVYIDLCTSHEH
ncbi:MAG: F0F1 ATP synthase subunit A [Thermoanaerobacterales bacterium]|mgnify:FL=1|nr:ATP synthase F0 subunit A [Thermoanaerobacterales bacterium]